MDRKTITFRADDQVLVKLTGADTFAADIVSYIDAQFDLGNNWSGFDAVRAVWSSATDTISTVLDAEGKCVVPAEVLRYPSRVMVSLVGSTSEGVTLTDRLTTYAVVAFVIDKDTKLTGSETPAVTPSQFEQFVSQVRGYVEAIGGDLVPIVNEWLEDHPEATTTVEDGAITYSKLNDSLKTFVTPEMFGAKVNDINSASVNSVAFANAIETGKALFLSKGIYYIDDTIMNPHSIIGQGARVSTISMVDTTKPVIKFTQSTSLITLDSFGIKYNLFGAGSDDTLTNAIAIYIDAITFGQSLLNELFIENVYSGIYSIGEMYSDTLSNLWINHYSFDAIHLQGNGTTGSILSNVYITNWENYGERIRNKSRYGVFLQNFTECILTQINVEHTISTAAICLTQCETVVISDLHVEGFIPISNYIGIVNNIGSHIRILNLSIVYSGSNSVGYTSGITEATMVAVFALTYAKAVTICDVLSMRNNGWDFATSGKYLVYTNATDDATRRLTINEILDSDNMIGGSSGAAMNCRKPQVQRLGKTIYWEEIGHDRVIRFLTTTAPDSSNLAGEFYVGDKFNVRDCTNDISDYCVTASGNYSEPLLSAKGYAEQYNGVVFLTNNNDDLKSGDRIKVNGNVYTLTSNPYGSSAHSGYPFAVNITPNIAAGSGGNNLDINFAAPEVKGFAFVE